MLQTARDPPRGLGDLNDAQRAAVQATGGPLVILAGAGTGKTRVISRRAAYAIETGVVSASRILLVTFTDKAANEMVERMAALGHPSVMARTFHSHAVRQLRHFWPSRHGGADPPQILDSKLPLIRPLARSLPGGYKHTPSKDLADAIEWAKVRRIPPERWEQDAPDDRAPIPQDLFARIYAGYERAKERAHRVDFEDMLALTVELLESDENACRLVQSQKTWISVDEYQDTIPLQERLLELWIGAVVAAGPEVAQLADGVRVEGARHHVPVAQGGHAPDHLAGGLVGKRDQQDPRGRDDAGLDRVRRATADHARLAGARAGQNDQRAAGGLDGLALGVVEVVHSLRPSTIGWFEAVEHRVVANVQRDQPRTDGSCRGRDQVVGRVDALVRSSVLAGELAGFIGDGDVDIDPREHVEELDHRRSLASANAGQDLGASWRRRPHALLDVEQVLEQAGCAPVAAQVIDDDRRVNQDGHPSPAGSR